MQMTDNHLYIGSNPITVVVLFSKVNTNSLVNVKQKIYKRTNSKIILCSNLFIPSAYGKLSFENLFLLPKTIYCVIIVLDKRG